MHRLLISALVGAFFASAVAAQHLRAVARVDMARSTVTDTGTGVELALALTQAVPYRLYALSDPMRIVVEFREVRFERDLSALDRAERIKTVSPGAGGACARVRGRFRANRGAPSGRTARAEHAGAKR